MGLFSSRRRRFGRGRFGRIVEGVTTTPESHHGEDQKEWPAYAT